jgi:hypothetical protein
MPMMIDRECAPSKGQAATTIGSSALAALSAAPIEADVEFTDDFAKVAGPVSTRH